MVAWEEEEVVVASMVVVVERGISRSDGTMGRRSRRSKRGVEEEVLEEGVQVWAVRLAEGAEEEGVVEDRRLRQVVALVEGEAAAARHRIIKAITTISSTAIMEEVEGIIRIAGRRTIHRRRIYRRPIRAGVAVVEEGTVEVVERGTSR